MTSHRRFTNVKKERLSKPYKLRLPIEFETNVLKLSKESGKTISSVLRECLLSSHPVIRSRTPVALQQDRLTALRLLQKSSNNINQVARSLNTLNLKNELTYEQSLHYLHLLDTIEARMNICLGLFNDR